MPADRSAQRFMSILNDVNLQQHVAESTHMSGHILDLVISPVPSHLVSSTTVSTMMSDHCWVHVELNNKKPAWPLKEITLRKVKGIDHDTFQRDILSSSLVLDSENDCNILEAMYHNNLSCLLNKHAPLISKTVRVRPRVPWFNEDIKLAQRERRRREQKWKYTQPESD